MREALFLVAALAASSPAAAEVVAVSDGGFVSRNLVEVAATPQEAWETMLRPAQWWNKDHTYAGDAAWMKIDPRAGACFCERIPGKAGAPDGEVEHMRVVFVAPQQTLRMRGGLGPLQSEAVTAVLTMTLAPHDGGTRITWEYVVGGYMRRPMKDIAPLVDAVLEEQLTRLAAQLHTD